MVNKTFMAMFLKAPESWLLEATVCGLEELSRIIIFGPYFISGFIF